MDQDRHGASSSTVTGSGRLRYNRGLALLTAFLFPVLMILGCWQLMRADEKTDALQVLELRRGEPPLPLASIVADSPEELDRRQVELYGHYLSDRDFLLDNRIHEGRVGFELISAFQDDGGTVVLVNRGWLPGLRTRDQLPVPPRFEQNLRLHGEIYLARDRRRLPLLPAGTWPKLIQAVDTQAMGRLLGSRVYPHVVRLREGQPSALEADWPAVNIQPERHVAYAVQWFMMGAALLAIFLFGGTNFIDWYKNRGRGGEADD